MKKRVAIGAAVVASLLCICLSFSLGLRQGQRDAEDLQAQRCRALLSFSVDRLGELKARHSPEVAAALTSHVYAAYWCAQDAALSSALHDLWNALVFDGENLSGREDRLIAALEAQNAQGVRDLAREVRASGE